MYRCEAKTVAGFVQQIAVGYLRNGYFFYVSGELPEGKDPEALDRKLILKYGIDVSKWSRARRKLAGMANVQYIRYGRFYVILATHGKHAFFEEEKSRIKDVRRIPIKFFGHSISSRWWEKKGRWVAHVGIERERYKDLKAYFCEIAPRRSLEALAAEFQALPFEPYAHVRRQLVSILKRANQARMRAGLEPLHHDGLRLRRRILRPFEERLSA